MKKLLILLALLAVLIIGCTRKSCPAYSDVDKNRVTNNTP